jgi:hypothetical protein
LNWSEILADDCEFASLEPEFQIQIIERSAQPSPSELSIMNVNLDITAASGVDLYVAPDPTAVPVQRELPQLQAVDMLTVYSAHRRRLQEYNLPVLGPTC